MISEIKVNVSSNNSFSPGGSHLYLAKVPLGGKIIDLTLRARKKLEEIFFRIKAQEMPSFDMAKRKIKITQYEIEITEANEVTFAHIKQPWGQQSFPKDEKLKKLTLDLETEEEIVSPKPFSKN